MKKHLVFTIIILFNFTQLFSQENPLPLNIQKAYQNETRSEDGNPGPAYWQNSSDYAIDVEVDTENDQITGSAIIQYTNNSPDTLKRLVLRLYQDLFRKGNARQWPIPDGDISSGMTITRMVIDGLSYDPEKDFPQWLITNLRVRLKEYIDPGTTSTIELEWHFHMPTVRGLRMRKYDEGHYFIAYWYPQIAVYDDVDGWDLVEYTGLVEFYNDINNYNVNISVPGDYIVWATGELQNRADVLLPGIIDRFNHAKSSDKVVHIITQKDYKDKAVTVRGKKHTWKFTASGVPDFSFAMSTRSNWDGTSLVVDQTSGRRVLTDAVYPGGSDQWMKGAEVSRACVEYLSYTLPGTPFPYPHMTSVWSGGRGGGMETPMMANDGAPKKYSNFVELIFHEISHTYFPFYMGTNERKYAWMDEGWAAYLPTELTNELSPENDYLKETCEGYTYFAGQEAELPLMVPSFQHNNFSSARVAAYTRPAMAYHFLRDALGDEMFKKALRMYIKRWNGKHPLPYDFFNTFNDITGENLDWFWQPWFFASGYPDLGIKGVTENNEVIIEKLGTHPIPISLNYLTVGNTSKNIYHSTAVWKDGKNEFIIKLPEDIKLQKAELGNDHIPDVNKGNNVWVKE
jgi:hypothetical protein